MLLLLASVMSYPVMLDRGRKVPGNWSGSLGAEFGLSLYWACICIFKIIYC